MDKTRTAIVSALASTTVLVGALLIFSEHIFKLLSEDTFEMKDCKNDISKAAAVVSIIMPTSSDFNLHSRKVTYSLADYIDTDIPDPNSDVFLKPDGTPQTNDPLTPGGHVNINEPFHIFAKQLVDSGKSGYVLVRVIIQDSSASKFTFYNDGKITGVGQGVERSSVLCGARISEEVPGGTRQVAKFHINLDNLRKEKSSFFADFNIAIKMNAYQRTPFFIDPKVHNDG